MKHHNYFYLHCSLYTENSAKRRETLCILLRVLNRLDVTSNKTSISETKSILRYIRNRTKYEDLSNIIFMLENFCDIKMKQLFRS